MLSILNKVIDSEYNLDYYHKITKRLELQDSIVPPTKDMLCAHVSTILDLILQSCIGDTLLIFDNWKKYELLVEHNPKFVFMVIIQIYIIDEGVKKLLQQETETQKFELIFLDLISERKIVGYKSAIKYFSMFKKDYKLTRIFTQMNIIERGIIEACELDFRSIRHEFLLWKYDAPTQLWMDICLVRNIIFVTKQNNVAGLAMLLFPTLLSSNYNTFNDILLLGIRLNEAIGDDLHLETNCWDIRDIHIVLQTYIELNIYKIKY